MSTGREIVLLFFQLALIWRAICESNPYQDLTRILKAAGSII
jgi:hypothetical protein